MSWTSPDDINCLSISHDSPSCFVLSFLRPSCCSLQQNIYREKDVDNSGTMSSTEMRDAVEKAGENDVVQIRRMAERQVLKSVPRPQASV